MPGGLWAVTLHSTPSEEAAWERRTEETYRLICPSSAFLWASERYFRRLCFVFCAYLFSWHICCPEWNRLKAMPPGICINRRRPANFQKKSCSCLWFWGVIRNNNAVLGGRRLPGGGEGWAACELHSDVRGGWRWQHFSEDETLLQSFADSWWMRCLLEAVPALIGCFGLRWSYCHLWKESIIFTNKFRCRNVVVVVFSFFWQDSFYSGAKSFSFPIFLFYPVVFLNLINPAIRSI